MSAERIVRNVSVSTFVYILGSIAGLILVPILLGTIGPTQFGLYVLAQTTVSFASLTNGGINRGFVRSIVAREASGGAGDVRLVVGTGLTLMAAFAVGITLLMTACFPLLVSVFHVPTTQQTDFAWVLGGVVVAYAITITVNPFQALLVAKGRLDLVKSTEAGLIVGGSLLSAAAVLLGYGLPGLGVATASAAVPAALTIYFTARRIAAAEVRVHLMLDRPVLRELWHFGSRIQLVTLAGVVNRSVDRITIGIFRSTSAVAAYDVADRAAFSIVYTANTMAEALFPRMVGHLARDDVAAARETYARANAIFCLAAMTVGTFAVFQSPQILYAWLGRVDPTVAFTLSILAAGYATAVSLSATSLVALAQPRPTLAMRFSTAQAAVNVALSVGGVLLAGVVGAAAGSALTGGLGTMLYSFLVERKILKISGTSGMRSLGKTALLTVPIAGMLGAGTWYLTTTLGLGRIAVLVALAAAFATQLALSALGALRLGLVQMADVQPLLDRIPGRRSGKIPS